VRSSGGSETELTTGSAEAVVSRTVNGNGYQTATWTPPETILNAGDSIVVRVQGDTTSPPTTVRETFTTEQIGGARLEASEWTVQYWTRRAGAFQGGTDWYWGSSTYENFISGFQWTEMTVRDPLQDNTLNWTESTAGDLDHYNIYRSTDGTPSTFNLIDTAPPGSDSYIDPDHGAYDGTLWWYIVRAVDAANNEDTNNNFVQEGGIIVPPYEIDLSGIGAGEWAFVSFPSGLTGNILTILDDSASPDGDGATTWTIARWYDPTDAADPWKTYRVGSSFNDMPTIDNKMGFWLWITANGGDHALTLNTYSAVPASTVIHLYPGWNLVGFPSSTNILGSALPAAVDILSVYSASGTYTDYVGAAMDPITLSNGHAYFMHATADADWTVMGP
jgi:hypothetical protein